MIQMQLIGEVEVIHKTKYTADSLYRCLCGREVSALVDYRNQEKVCDCGRVYKAGGLLTGEVMEVW